MANLLPSSKWFQEVEKKLLYEQEQIKKQLTSLEESDPLTSEALPEATEPGSESFHAEGHAKLSIFRNNLLNIHHKITRTLNMLRNGSYGKCENCSKPIDEKRLEALPIATTCAICI